jgi:glycosyltransferase involved in cell wall biosynthesis
MIHYILPGVGIYGGIKVGFQFSALLDSLGVPIVVATPDGRAPDWMTTSVSVCSHEEALGESGGSGPLLFSLPYDYELLRETGRPLYFHCQGTDPAIDPILTDRSVRLLTCWSQARDYVVQKTGRQPIEVGISISDVFFYQGEAKLGHVVACMPRRGAALIEAARRAVPGLHFEAVDGANEARVAAVMKRAAFYLSTSPDEWFGLPALEAMAAGCAVVSVPVPKAAEYLYDGENAYVVECDALGTALSELADPAAAKETFRLRNAALATATRYRLSRQRRRLRALLECRLREWLI